MEINSILKDIVAHTHSLGFLDLIKVTSENNETIIHSRSEDRNVILDAKMHNPVTEITGTFGLPNLEKLDLHLKNPEYQENAKIQVITEVRNDVTVPAYIHFENSSGDYQNNYRFMSKEQIENLMKTAKFRGASWNVVFKPSELSIQRMKLMSSSNSEEPNFNVSTEVTGGVTDLIFKFGDANSHGGKFVFESNVSGKMSHTLSWPVKQVMSILNLTGDTTMSISDQGAMKIAVDSGIALYEYILPAQQV